MPWPVLFTIVALLGWPALQIASLLATRTPRRRMHALAADLRSDPAYGSADLTLLERTIAEARGAPAYVTFPLLLPVALLAAALTELFGNRRPSSFTRTDQTLRSEIAALELGAGLRNGSETIDDDARFQELEELSIIVGATRWPVTSLLTVATCMPVLPVYLIAYGLRQTGLILPRAAALLVRAVQMSGLALQGAVHR